MVARSHDGENKEVASRIARLKTANFCFVACAAGQLLRLLEARVQIDDSVKVSLTREEVFDAIEAYLRNCFNGERCMLQHISCSADLHVDAVDSNGYKKGPGLVARIKRETCSSSPS
jgi:hypothetical protein